MTSTGIIEINTTCSDIAFHSCDSEVFIDGQFVGYAPMQLFLPTGNHSYKIVKPGYFPSPTPPPPLMAGIANVQYGLKLALDISLTNSATTGGLSINSSPDGAQIFINGKDQNKTTPAVISELTPGDHKYKMTLHGYEDVEGTFTMTFGQTTSIYITFVQSKDFGTLYLYSTPVLYGRIDPFILQGADIYIDNVNIGRHISSPITGLTKGIHTFRIERSGTVDRDGIFIINGGDTLLISVYPILQPKIGMLIMRMAPFVGDTKPARVYIDGKDIGHATDIRHALPEGTHTYRLQLDEYEDVEGKFEILTNRITRVTAYMQRIGIPITGSVNIASNPPGALVAIDDVYLGQYTPTKIKKLFDGDYTYRISKPGYLDATGTFTITKGNTIDLNPSLIQTDIILDISSNVIATMVYIDNRTEGWTTPTEIIGLPPGDHTYRLIIPDTYGDGFEDATGTFKLEDKKTTFVNADLHLKKEGKGNLIINSVPISARVFVDDIDTKTITPNSIIGMDPGIHTIKLTLEGYKDWMGTVSIIPGGIVSIFEVLIPEK